MNKKNMEIYYDSEADILEIFIGEPTPSYYDEIDDDLFEGHDKKTGEIKGYAIFNVRKTDNPFKTIDVDIPEHLSNR